MTLSHWLVPALDIRSGGLARIALGIICILDLVRRYDDLQAFHTSDGMVPPAMSPHQAPVHKFFFYRGSTEVQVSAVLNCYPSIVCPRARHSERVVA